MSLSLNHYSIRTHDLEASRRFYIEALGLAVGPRPDFPFPGAWLYAGDTSVSANAAVHLIGIDRDAARLHGSGAVDHVAFFATGLAARRARLERLGIAVRELAVPGLGLHQLFVEDPNGIVVELNFPAAEAKASGAAPST